MTEKKKRQRPRAGDVFAVPLDDGSHAVGQMLGHEPEALNSFGCAFYDLRSAGAPTRSIGRSAGSVPRSSGRRLSRPSQRLLWPCAVGQVSPSELSRRAAARSGAQAWERHSVEARHALVMKVLKPGPRPAIAFGILLALVAAILSPRSSACSPSATIRSRSSCAACRGSGCRSALRLSARPMSSSCSRSSSTARLASSGRKGQRQSAADEIERGVQYDLISSRSRLVSWRRTPPGTKGGQPGEIPNLSRAF